MTQLGQKQSRFRVVLRIVSRGLAIRQTRGFIIILFFLITSFLFINSVFAERPLEVSYPEVGGLKPETTTFGLPDFVRYIFIFSLAAAGVFVFGSFVYAGFQYLTSAGNPAKISDAKDRIFSTVIGLLVIFGSYLLLTTVNPQLVFLKLPEITGCDCQKPQGELSSYCRLACAPTQVFPGSEEKTLSAEEIPIGKLIDGAGAFDETTKTYSYEGVLAETRLKRINDLTQTIVSAAKEIFEVSIKIKNASDEIKNASEAIKQLTRGCSCANIAAQRIGKDTYICRGDPCGPQRAEIIRRENALKAKNQELAAFKSELDSLSLQLQGKAEELRRESEKLTLSLEEFKKARSLMISCPGSLSENRISRELLTYNEFWQLKEDLEKKGTGIKEVKINYPWQGVRSEDDPLTFYCVENSVLAWTSSGNEMSGLSFSESDIDLIKPSEEIDFLPGPQGSCGPEIKIGNTIDETQKIGESINKAIQGMSQELSKFLEGAGRISQEIPLMRSAASDMAALPGRCSDAYPLAPCSALTGEQLGQCGRPTQYDIDWNIDYPRPCPADEINGALFGVTLSYGIIDNFLKGLSESYQKITTGREMIRKVAGIYLCEGQGCPAEKSVRLFTKNNQDIVGTEPEWSNPAGEKVVNSNALYVNDFSDVRLWSEKDLKGENICFTKSIYELGCYGWQNRAKSLEILNDNDCASSWLIESQQCDEDGCTTVTTTRGTIGTPNCLALEEEGKLEKTMPTASPWIPDIGQSDTERIISNLKSSRSSFKSCVTSDLNLKKIERGEKAILEQLESCKSMRTGLLSVFPDEATKQKLTNCYGADTQNLDRTENYFCCETETFGQ